MSQQKEHIKVSLSEVPVYEPPGHSDTYNRRLAAPSTAATTSSSLSAKWAAPAMPRPTLITVLTS